MDLDKRIEADELRLMSTGSMNDSNTVFELYMSRVDQEAKELKYDPWYGVDEYDGNVLLQADEDRFISLLYGLVLKRKVGIEDYRSVFRALHLDHQYRIDIIDGILNSDEAHQKPIIKLTGLEIERKRVERKRKLKTMPVVGRIVTWIHCWIHLPQELDYLETQIGQIKLQLSAYDAVNMNVENLNRDLNRVKKDISSLNHSAWKSEKELSDMQRELFQMERSSK